MSKRAQKINDMAGSQNFSVALFTMAATLIITIFNVSGADIDSDTVDKLVKPFSKGNYLPLVLVALPNLIMPIMKTLKSGTIDLWWVFKNSGNFRTQLASLLALLSGAAGMEFDQSAFAAVINAIPGGSFSMVVSTFCLHFGNSILHWLEVKMFHKVEQPQDAQMTVS